ncbi:MAG TPA: endonuclease/exonuclease/phosphatase family protein, partial [Bacteroidia bacterium]|nr:endonuclease/exonuclease/phosphatase family protein [Bacteroidia bacterium]
GVTTSNACMYADVLIDNDTLRVYNAHLESIRFKKQDYTYVDDIRKNVEQNNYSGILPILKRLKTAFIKRATETEIIKQHKANCKLPLIFCGDFNDTPASYTYKQIAGTLKDAFKDGNAGFGTTYNGVFPAFRIDYILYSPHIAVSQFTTHKIKLSDHCPLTATIHLKP